MSVYDSIRGAIAVAIQHGDPLCPASNIHDYFRFVQKPTAQSLNAILRDSTDPNHQVYHGWQFTRGASRPDIEEAEGGGKTVISNGESWYIKGVYSIDDDAASERTFQNIIESVQNALRNDDAIIALADYQVYCNSVSRSDLQLMKLNGEEIVHYVELTVDFDLNDQ